MIFLEGPKFQNISFNDDEIQVIFKYVKSPEAAPKDWQIERELTNAIVSKLAQEYIDKCGPEILKAIDRDAVLSRVLLMISSGLMK